MTCTAAAFLATELLGAVGDLAAILGLGIAVTLVGEVLHYVEIDGVIIGLDTEDVLCEVDLLSGICSVDFVNRKFHNYASKIK